MTDDAAMLAAIIDRPDDDTPRLAYADWLDDQGEADRAAFIRAQVEYARIPECVIIGGDQPCCPRCSALERSQVIRESLSTVDGITQANGWHWSVLLPHTGSNGDVAWSRGFVESVTCSAADWLAHADGILAAHPVRRVRLADRPGYLIGMTVGDQRLYRFRGVERSLPAAWGDTSDQTVMALLKAEWSGVAFELPEATFPPVNAAGFLPAGDRLVSHTNDPPSWTYAIDGAETTFTVTAP